MCSRGRGQAVSDRYCGGGDSGGSLPHSRPSRLRQGGRAQVTKMSIYAFLKNCSNQKCSSLFSYNLYQYKFTYCCSVITKSKQKASFPERKFHEILQSLFFVNTLDLANFAILIFFQEKCTVHFC